MKKINMFYAIAVYSMVPSLIFPQTSSINYLGQTPPGNTPEVFAPGIISISGRKERSFTISPNGDEIFFCKAGFPYSKIYQMVKTDTGWTAPFLAEFTKNYYATEPAFSPDGKTLIFSTKMGRTDEYNWNIWCVKKTDGEWSAPESLFDVDSNRISEYHPSATQDGKIYFCYWRRSNNTGDLYMANPGPDGYLISRIEMPVNSNYQDVDPFIAPDESYLIFKSTRSGGYGGMDNYISYKKADGSWTNPKNLGPKINTSQADDVGDISPDGKYMFFTRNDNIYWVDAGFVDSLKFTNYNPYVLNAIPDTSIPVNKAFTFKIEDSTFIDDDGNETLLLSVALHNGNELPEWLDFDTTSNTFEGTPPEAGSLNIKVTATDDAESTISDIFKLTIEEITGVEDQKKNTNELLVFPNPAQNTIQIEYPYLLQKEAYYRIIDLSGKTVQKGYLNSNAIDIAKLIKGEYLLSLNIENEMISKKIVIE